MLELETITPMKVNTIYVAGPISGMPNLNKERFKDAQRLLKQFAPVVINPHDLPAYHDKKWNSYMKVCLPAVCKADAVYVLDGWKHSRGAIIEVIVSKVLLIPVFSILDFKEVPNTVHS